MRSHRWAPVVAMAMSMTMTAAACGSDGGSSGSPTTAATTTTAPTTSAPTTRPPTLAPTTTAAPTTTSPPPTTAAPTTTVAAAPQPCGAASIRLTAGQTEGAMGSAYTPLLLTNIGATDCTLSTHVVMTFLDENSQAIGPSVSTPEAAGPGVVTLGPTETRQALFRYGQPGNFPCDAIGTPTTLQLTINQTEMVSLQPMDWPVCPDRIPDQISLNDLELPS